MRKLETRTDASLFSTFADAQGLYVLKNNERIKLNVALNYGGRPEIVEAMKRIMDSGISASEINEELKYEVSRGGAEFPHLFADLPISAVGQVWLVSPVNGAYTLPDDLNAN